MQFKVEVKTASQVNNVQSKLIRELKNYLSEQRKQGNDLILTTAECNGLVYTPNLMGKEVIPGSIDVIKKAQTEVLIMGYKLDSNCDATKELMSALSDLDAKAKKTGKPIRVRILIDTLDSLPSFIYSPNRDAEQFRTARFSHLDFQYAQHHHIAFGTYHSKQIIIDGKFVVLNSGDFDKDKNYKHGELACIDIGTILEGKNIANHVRKDFIQAWNSKHSYPLAGSKKPIPEELKQNILNTIRSKKPISGGLISMLYLSKRAEGCPIGNHLSPTILALIFAIQHATDVIHIMTPNLNVPEVIEALADANARGITINLIMSPRMNRKPQSLPFGGGSNENRVKQLFSSVRQREKCDLSKLHVRWNVDGNNKIILTEDANSGPLPIHAKLACIDNKIVITGSSPLDLQANRSRESDICFDSAEVAQTYLNKIFFPIFDCGAEVYSDQESKLIFTIQEILEKTIRTSQDFIILLEHKVKHCTSIYTMTKKITTQNILDTLYELKEKASLLLEKNSQQINSQEIKDLWNCSEKINQKINAADKFFKAQGIFYQIKTFLFSLLKIFLYLKNNLEFRKKFTTHSLINHLSEELSRHNKSFQSINSTYRGATKEEKLANSYEAKSIPILKDVGFYAQSPVVAPKDSTQKILKSPHALELIGQLSPVAIL